MSGQKKFPHISTPARTFTHFYWRTHEFGHAYVDMYAHFFWVIF